MSNEFTGLRETPEELEIRRRETRFRRMRMFTIILVVCIAARFLIKDPKPPKAPPPRSNKSIKYIPGMIEAIPIETLNKMDPQLVAQMRAAEAKYNEEKALKNLNIPAGQYKPADIPLVNDADLEALRQAEFAYAKRQLTKMHEEKVRLSRDLTKPMLIHFRSGGFVKAEAADPIPNGVNIHFDRTLSATVPKRMVAAISANAFTWREPVPVGCVQLKPAKGITITVKREIAKRITIQRSPFDET